MNVHEPAPTNLHPQNYIQKNMCNVQLKRIRTKIYAQENLYFLIIHSRHLEKVCVRTNLYIKKKIWIDLLLSSKKKNWSQMTCICQNFFVGLEVLDLLREVVIVLFTCNFVMKNVLCNPFVCHICSFLC